MDVPHVVDRGWRVAVERFDVRIEILSGRQLFGDKVVLVVERVVGPVRKGARLDQHRLIQLLGNSCQHD